MKNKILRISVSFAFLGLFCLAAAEVATAQNLKPEEIVEKHLEAIGGRAKLVELKNRLVSGSSAFESKLPNQKTGGKAILASDNDNMMFLASFASQQYAFEKVGFFDGKMQLPNVVSGGRSPLGTFLAEHDKVLSNGLFAGAMSGAWGMIWLDKHKPRLSSDGTKKVDGKKAYVLQYTPRGPSSTEFSIRLFFDAETFYHLRTEYLRITTPVEVRAGILGRQSGTRMTLTETYGDFKKAQDFMLPHSYNAVFVSDSNSGVLEFIWGVNVVEYQFNRELSEDFFKF